MRGAALLAEGALADWGTAVGAGMFKDLAAKSAELGARGLSLRPKGDRTIDGEWHVGRAVPIGADRKTRDGHSLNGLPFPVNLDFEDAGDFGNRLMGQSRCIAVLHHADGGLGATGLLRENALGDALGATRGGESFV